MKSKIIIHSADDTTNTISVDLEWEYSSSYDKNAHPNIEQKDPIQGGLIRIWDKILNDYRVPVEYNSILKIASCPVHIIKTKRTYRVNGKVLRRPALCALLARLTFRAAYENDTEVLLKSLYSNLAIPETIRYCLENRFPYFFYDNYEREEVRLNMQQVSDTEVALEVADGVWGVLSIKEADKLCLFYVDGNKKSKYRYLSPYDLYKLVMGRDPLDSELKVMIAFLKQNRKSDIVEARAIELVNELIEEYEGRLHAKWENNTLKSILVKGNDYDWLLTNNEFKADRQQVSTYVWQPSIEALRDEDYNVVDRVESDPSWKGPICIDNMAPDSPLGDQFATRALALLNDNITTTMVNTIRRYLIASPNKYRVDNNEMS